MLKTAGLLLLALGAVLFGWRYGEKEKRNTGICSFFSALWTTYATASFTAGRNCRHALNPIGKSFLTIPCPFSGKEITRTLCNGCISMKN